MHSIIEENDNKLHTLYLGGEWSAKDLNNLR